MSKNGPQEYGFSLIEVLVTMTVMLIGMMIMAGYMANVSNQQRALMSKTAAIAINTNLESVFSPSSEHCTGNIANAAITFIAGSPPALPQMIACPGCGPGHTAIYYYSPLGAVIATDLNTGPQNDGTGLNIANVQLENIQTTSTPHLYKADVVINYAGTNPILPAAKVASQILIAATPVGANDKLNSCSPVTMTAGLTPKLTPGHTGPGNCLGPPAIPAGWTPLQSLGAGRNCFAFVAANGAGNSFSSEGCYYNSADGWVYGCDNNSAIICEWTCF